MGSSLLKKGCGVNEFCEFVSVPREVEEDDDSARDLPLKKEDSSSLISNIDPSIQMMLDRLDIIVDELRRNNRQTQQRLKKIEKTTDEQDAVQNEIDRIKHYMDNQSRFIEYEVTWGIAELLNGIILLTRYVFEGDESGDLDGLVVVQWKDEEVLVCIEVKHCLSSRIACRNVVAHAEKASSYLEELRKTDPEKLRMEVLDEAIMLKDYNNLHVSEYKSQKIMLAFGGPHFPQEAAEFFPKCCKRDFFLMTSDPQYKYRQMVPIHRSV